MPEKVARFDETSMKVLYLIDLCNVFLFHLFIVLKGKNTTCMHIYSMCTTRYTVSLRIRSDSSSLQQVLVKCVVR